MLDYTDFSIIEKKHSVGEITVPYIPGCLAFREYDLVEKTVSLLENKVDLFAFDGNGYLHPRHTKVRGTVLMSCFPFNLR